MMPSNSSVAASMKVAEKESEMLKIDLKEQIEDQEDLSDGEEGVKPSWETSKVGSTSDCF